MAAVGPGESGDTTGIWAISILGGPPRKLRNDAGRASVSPDGAHIAYISSRSESEIWVMGASGESPTKLLQGALGERFLQVQWSPDGERIAYLQSRTNGDKSEKVIETVPVTAGIKATILSDPGLRSFCWSSDNRMIYSMQDPPPSDRDMNLWELQVAPSGAKASGSPRRITNWAGLSLLDLSVSADGKHLLFVNAGLQSDLYVAELESKSGFGPPRRFTLEGRNNLPSAWTPDGQTLFFSSDRNGNWDIFRQRLAERSAQDFVFGPGDQTDPRLSPDASWVLYWNPVAKAAEGTAPMHLLRVPIAGGAPEPVLEATRGAAVRCARGHSPCVLSEPDDANDELVFTSFDPLRGRIAELLRLAAIPGAPAWDLSPDGSTVAIVDLDEHRDRIRLVELESGSSHSISVGHSQRLSGISWAAEGKTWFVTGSSLRGAALLQVRLDGATSELWTSNTNLVAPLVSPDNKNLAFSTSTYNSNAWVIENF